MSEYDSLEITAKVHERLHAKDATRHHGLPCHSYALGDVVWETLALLGERGLIELEAQNDAARKRLE